MARKIVAPPDLPRQRQQPHEHRRHPLAMRHSIPLNQRQRPRRIEPPRHDARPTTAQHMQREPVRCGVIQRSRRQINRVRRTYPRRRQNPRDRQRHPTHLRTQQRPEYPLRMPGRARRIHQIPPDRPQRQRPIRLPRHHGAIVDRIATAAHQRHDHPRQNRQMAKILRLRHHHPRAAIPQDVVDLRPPQMRADRRVVNPRPLRRERQLEHLHAVVQQHRNPRPRRQPQTQQPMRRLRRPPVQHGIAHAQTRVRKDARHLLRRPPRPIPQRMRPHARHTFLPLTTLLAPDPACWSTPPEAAVKKALSRLRERVG